MEESDDSEDANDTSYNMKNSSYDPKSISNNFLIDLDRTTKNSTTRGYLIIEVIDSGIGMTEEGIQKLFQPFTQANKSIQTKYGGTGLGLWITNKLVGLMDGKIMVKSELNKGSAFIVLIPVNAEHINDETDQELKNQILSGTISPI